MYQARAKHPASIAASPISADVRESMWRLFVAVGSHWKTLDDATLLRSRFDSFLDNRVALMPLYADYYEIAQRVVNALISKHAGDEAAAYADLFTSVDATKQPPTTELALTRQAVSNEFVTLHTALAGFLALGPQNWPGYFGGANVPGAPAPYRPMSTHHGD